MADSAAEKNDTAEVATDAAAQAAVQVPLALLGTLLTTPLGPGAAVGGAKILGRNLPLVLLLALVALLFWPTRTDEAAAADTSEEGDELCRNRQRAVAARAQRGTPGRGLKGTRPRGLA